jgi:hypothetical protein
MVGITWTIKGFDEHFMQSRLPAFSEVNACGTQRVKNPKKDAFIEQTCIDYEAQFPGHSSTWELKGIGQGGEPTERNRLIRKVSTHLPS